MVRPLGRVLVEHDGRARDLLRRQGAGRFDRRGQRLTSTDLTGSYELALYATGALMLAGAAIPLALRAPRPAR